MPILVSFFLVAEPSEEFDMDHVGLQTHKATVLALSIFTEQGRQKPSQNSQCLDPP
jgi:hypothetical protein